MHNSFYEELDLLKENDADASFGFLENIEVRGESTLFTSKGRKLTAYDYLHGYCDSFTYVLNKRYGYPIFEIRANDGSLVHCFAKVDVASSILFIDVRGITTDYFEFIR